jgi:hypothetical protein
MAKKIIITARNKNSFIRTLLLVNYQWLCSAWKRVEAQGMPASAKAAISVFSCQK